MRATVSVVAIDGPGGAGKSTTARAVAVRLGLSYLDTGALYRCVALRAVEEGLALDPTFLEGQSDPDDDLYVWSYTVKIHNGTGDNIRVRTRHWLITNAKGRRSARCRHRRRTAADQAG